MVNAISLLSFAAAASAAALPSGSTSGFHEAVTHDSAGGLANCISGVVPVAAKTTMNEKLNFDFPANQSQVTQTFLEMVTTGSTLMKRIAGPKATVSGTYNISASLCFPKSGSQKKTVQFLTHGIGLTKDYWNFAPKYSYVDVAAANGYPTFYYDRLGVGASEKPNAIQVVQTPLELAIAYSLIEKLRAGQLGATKFTKIIATGHSFGSILTVGLASQYPKSIDAAVLTGFSVNMTAVPVFLSALNLAIASENQPDRFANLSTGYLVADSIISNQFDFFRAPGFAPRILKLAEAGKGSTTFGELFTMTSVAKPAKQFTGPVAVVNGINDYPFCSGNCAIPTNQAAAVQKALFPKVKAFTTYLAPVAGHALNLHYSAKEAFEHIQAFVKANKL